MYNKRFILNTSLILVVALLVGFVSFSSVARRPDENTMVIGIPNEPATLDPQQYDARMTQKILFFMHEPVLHNDPETGEYLPGLAESYEISEDGTVWTFHIREDVTFSDGTPLTAEDFKYTYERALEDETYHTTREATGTLQRVEVVDEYTYKLYFEEPFAPFHFYLFRDATMPINQKVVEERGEDFGINPAGSGTGPFKFESWESGERIVLVRNEKYNWGSEDLFENQGPPAIERVVFELIPDTEVATMALIQGEVDAIDFLPSKEADSMIANPNIQVFQQNLPGIGLYSAFNVTKPPFDEVEVRKAVNHAIDKETIIEVVKYGHANIAHGPIPPFFFGFNEDLVDYYEFDPEKARETLTEAGWVDESGNGIREKDGRELRGEFLVRSRSDYILTAQLLLEMFEDVGIGLDMQILEWGTLVDGLFAGEHNYALMGHGAGEPDVMHSHFHSRNIGAFNLAHISDPHLDELLVAQRRATDLDEREELLKEIQEYIMIENALWAPIYNDVQPYPVRARIQGLQMHPRGWFMPNDVRIVE